MGNYGNKIKKKVRANHSIGKKLAKQEIRKMLFEKKILSFLFVSTILTLSLLFLFLISHLNATGYAVSSQAGDISELTIYREFETSYWAGTYGLALRVPGFTELLYQNYFVDEIERKDVFFDCFNRGELGGAEIYASTSNTINFNSLVPGNVSEIDDYTGCFEGIECAVPSFDQTMSIYVGDHQISNIPSTHTYRFDGNKTIFNLGVLSDGTNLVFVSPVVDIQESYNEEKLVNFQMILPIPPSGEETYYFFTDPNDICPAGSGIGENIDANLTGYVFDSNGSPLENAVVSVAGQEVNTSSDGSYNLSFVVISGTYNVFISKTGYDNLFENISVNFSNYVFERNYTLSAHTPGLSELFNFSSSGYVRNDVGVPIASAKIILGSQIVYSDTSGYYSIFASLPEGNHSIVALKSSYDNYYFTLNFSALNTSIIHDIVMETTEIAYDFRTGPYTERPVDGGPGEVVIEEVIARGEDYWINLNEINKEVRKNTFIEDEIGIYNLRLDTLNLNFQVSSEISDFVKLASTTLSIVPDTYAAIKVTIYGTPPIGTYEGKITILGDLTQEIPVKIKVVEKKFPVELLLMQIDLFRNIVQPGELLKYKLNLQNLLRDENYQVELTAKMKDLNSEKTYYTEQFTAEVDNSLSLLKQIEIPTNISTGDYLLEIEAKYLNLISLTTASFVISRPIYMYAFFGIPLWIIFSIISFLSFLSLNLFLYRRHLAKKKRYQIAIDYDSLPKPGERIVKLGKIAETNHPAYYEIDRLTTHAIVAGATGMGKSISAQVVIEEALMQGVAVIVFDPTAQWSGMLRKCADKKMMAYYPKFGMKPKDARAFKGNVRQVQDAKQIIDITKHINEGQIQIFSLNKLDPKDMDIFVSNVIRQVFKSDPKEAPNLKTLIVFDEVHRLLPKFGGSGEGFLQIERACREFRKWGLGVMLISQVLNDFAGQIKANINTELQTRTLEEGDLERIRTKYGESFLKSLVRAEVGVVMFQNAEYNRGRPYFVNFRPILHSTRRLSDEELQKYNDYNDRVDDLEDSVLQLEKEGIDVFDLNMELKLIKDKIMSGSFSVVEIYLEGLEPRVTKEWEKLGKKPKKREIQLASEEEIKASIEEAKKEKEKAEAKEKLEAEEAKKEENPETKEEDKKEE